MPSGYVIFTEVIRDPARFDGYVQKATDNPAVGRPVDYCPR
jgi:hypothetical protein